MYTDEQRVDFLLGGGSIWYSKLVEYHDGCGTRTREEIDAEMRRQFMPYGK